MTSFFGVDLYFDNNDAQPAISVTVQQAQPFSFVPNANPVFALNGVTTAPGANTTSAVVGSFLIQLVFVNISNQLGIMDKVSLYNDVPDGLLDCGPGLAMRMTVTQLPEPATWTTVLLPLAALARYRRRTLKP